MGAAVWKARFGGFSIESLFAHLREKTIHFRLQRAVFRRFQGRILFHQPRSGLLRFLEQGHVPHQIGDFEVGQAVLTIPEKITGSCKK